jgi:hypothetical protein
MDEHKLDELVAVDAARRVSVSTIGVVQSAIVTKSSTAIVAGTPRAAPGSSRCRVSSMRPARSRDGALQYRRTAPRRLSVTDEAISSRSCSTPSPTIGTDGLCVARRPVAQLRRGRLALLQGCPRVFAALKDGEIPIGVAQELNKCTEDAHRFMLLDMAIRGGATVGLVRSGCTSGKRSTRPRRRRRAAPADRAPGPSPIARTTSGAGCGETHNTANMQPVQIHDYCLQQLIDPATGIVSQPRRLRHCFRRTREDAVALMQRCRALSRARRRLRRAHVTRAAHTRSLR